MLYSAELGTPDASPAASCRSEVGPLGSWPGAPQEHPEEARVRGGHSPEGAATSVEAAVQNWFDGEPSLGGELITPRAVSTQPATRRSAPHFRSTTLS